MDIKKYTAKNRQRALETTSLKLGYNATILNHKKFGEDVDTLTQQATTQALKNAQDSLIESFLNQSKRSSLPEIKPSDNGSSNIHDEDTIESLKKEVRSLRQIVEGQLSVLTEHKKQEQSSVREGSVKQLAKLGIQPQLLETLIRQTGNPEEKTVHEVTSAVLSNLSAKISVNENKIVSSGGTVTFIGPSGVGKTTTLAKLAGLYVKKHGAGSIVLICTDADRAGAYKQLRKIGEDLSVPAIKAGNTTELSQLLLALKQKKLILIDQGNLTQQEVRTPTILMTKNIADQHIQHFLVIPATTEYTTLHHLAQSLTAEVEGCILTKVDEAANLGDALSTLVRTKLPIAYWTDTSSIDDFLHQATAQELITKAVTMAGKANTSISKERFGERPSHALSQQVIRKPA